jgi:hypothetical protein
MPALDVVVADGKKHDRWFCTSKMQQFPRNCLRL